jgi:hypothetical protein
MAEFGTGTSSIAPSPQRGEGRGEGVAPRLRCLLPNSQERHHPLTLPLLRNGSLPLPAGARGI